MPTERNRAPILALDVADRGEALALLDRLGDALDWVKIGLRLFTAHGPDLVREIADRGYRVFLDLKLHDIPNTAAGAVESIARLPVELLTLHASGGREMLEWAARARDAHNPRLRLLGVTVLTSMDDAQLRALNVRASAAEQVLTLGDTALSGGADGLVCSPGELTPLRDRFGEAPVLVTPGIRPADSDRDEQKRVATPADAARDGADYIVVGRPVLRAADPAAAARAIADDFRRASGA